MKGPLSILLANPKSRSNAFESFGFVFPPLGLLYIAATSEKAGHKIKIEDFCISGKRPSAYDFSAFDVVGISTNTRRSTGAMDIAKKAKKDGCIVVMGGPHPAFADEEILGSGFVDYIVRGEGEGAFPELLTAIKTGGDISAVRGLSYLKSGVIIRTQQSDLIEDLDALPFPARHLVDIELYKKSGFKYGGKRPIAVLSSSRGCTHNCSFCITPQMYGKRWRSRSAASVMVEIEEVYYRYGYRAIAFCDDNFTASPQRVKELCHMLIEKKLDLWWWCLSTPNVLLQNEDMVKLMAAAGAKTVYLGVESADPETMKEFNKGMALDIPYRAVDVLKRNGIQAFASYIIGGLNEDVGTILRTLKFSRKLDTAVAQFTILTPYPGTALYHKIEGSLRHRKWHLYDGFHLVFRHSKVSFVMMELLLIWAYVSFYARGLGAVRGFMKVFIKNSRMLRRVMGTPAE
jgi:anaerobic magnesium-protoporphyrin IX monomethyl ester cyclase